MLALAFTSGRISEVWLGAFFPREWVWLSTKLWQNITGENYKCPCVKNMLFMMRCVVCRGRWRHQFSLMSATDILFLFSWKKALYTVLVVIYIWQFSLAVSNSFFFFGWGKVWKLKWCLCRRSCLSACWHIKVMDDSSIQFIVFVYKLNAPWIINCREQNEMLGKCVVHYKCCAGVKTYIVSLPLPLCGPSWIQFICHSLHFFITSYFLSILSFLLSFSFQAVQRQRGGEPGWLLLYPHQYGRILFLLHIFATFIFKINCYFFH